MARGLHFGIPMSFRNLDVWRVSMDLVDQVISAVRHLPPSEFVLRRHMQESAISIPSNIAEGYRPRNRRAAYQNHVSIAMGSQGELETQLEIAFRNGFLQRGPWAGLVGLNDRVGAMLNKLHDSLDT